MTSSLLGMDSLTYINEAKRTCEHWSQQEIFWTALTLLQCGLACLLISCFFPPWIGSSHGLEGSAHSTSPSSKARFLTPAPGSPSTWPRTVPVAL